jgi:hypothetical protein
MDLNKIADILLKDVESRFGPKCEEWKYYGIEIIKKGKPHLKYYIDTGNITITLSEKIFENDIYFKFQLGHEICHLLYPQKSRKTLKDDNMLVINEGISTLYSFYLNKDIPNFNLTIEDFQKTSPNYYEAFIAVNKLFEIDDNIIKKARKIEPKVNRFSKELIKSINNNIPDKLIEDLLKTF